MTDPAKRLVSTMPTATFGKLDELASGPRFAGNRSAALAWCVEIGAAVLSDQAVAGKLFAGPADALTAFASAQRKRP